MRVLRLVALSALLASTAAPFADARPKPRGFQGGKKFEANKTFGLGLELGAPTGLTGKYFVSPSGALDFGLGVIYGYYYGGDGIHVYADYLWHPLVLASPPAFELPFYVGVGGRFWDFDNGCDRNGRNCFDGGSAIGVRVPLGLAFDFNNVPLDIFIQLVPTLDFYRNYSARDVYVDIDLSVGVRYWFN